MLPAEELERRYLEILGSVDSVWAEHLPSDSGIVAAALRGGPSARQVFDYKYGLLRRISNQIENRVLVDAGCGAGDLSLLLALMGAKHVYSVDFSLACTEFARHLLEDRSFPRSMSGWCPWRSRLTFEEMIRLDLFYIENWSVGFDLGLLLRTIPAVLFARGAY